MLIVGCGYVGRRVAALYRSQGEPVTGLVRTAASAGQLAEAGVVPLEADLDGDFDLPAGEPRVLYLVAPPERGATDPRIARFLEAAQRRGVRRIVYLGTTGVYGDCGGDWVDEDRPVRPSVDRARRRWDAESRLRDWAERTGGELVILRVAGIYGPGRLPLERLRSGLPMVAEDEAPWTNRIHADDLAAVCVAAMARGRNGAVYNVADGHPGNMTDYFNRVADAAGLPRPPVIRMADAGGRLSEGLLSYLRESRRLSNRRMLDELGVVLRYPTLAEGLPACLAAHRDPS
jgi:nucleoside-diphosphate-sugar epimerase